MVKYPAQALLVGIGRAGLCLLQALQKRAWRVYAWRDDSEKAPYNGDFQYTTHGEVTFSSSLAYGFCTIFEIQPRF